MEDRTLFVVLGAGASFAASSDYDARPELRPPLVKELFDPRFFSILNRFPMARNAAPEIKDAMAGTAAPALSLEEFIRTRYRDSNDEFDRRRFLSLPLYLQRVLWSVSSDEGVDLDNLYRLINPLVAEFSHVCFITLNYDVLLDRCLYDFNPVDSMQHFTAHRRWSLIKLHGSVTWGFRLENVGAPELTNPSAALADKIDRSEIFHRWDLSEGALQVQSDGRGSTFNAYPALSVPLGPDDEIVCPPGHVEFVRGRLKEAGTPHVLVVGYSAYDKTVLDLLKESATAIGSLYVVNADRKSATDVLKRMCAHFGRLNIQSSNVAVAEEPFQAWVRSGLTGYLEWVARQP